MKIPPFTNKPRFYVAVSEKEALSSWDSMEDALACIVRFKGSDDYPKIVGVVRVFGTHRVMLSKEGAEKAGVLK